MIQHQVYTEDASLQAAVDADLTLFFDSKLKLKPAIAVPDAVSDAKTSTGAGAFIDAAAIDAADADSDAAILDAAHASSRALDHAVEEASAGIASAGLTIAGQTSAGQTSAGIASAGIASAGLASAAGAMDALGTSPIIVAPANKVAESGESESVERSSEASSEPSSEPSAWQSLSGLPRLGSFLSGLGLGGFQAAFEANEVDMDAIAFLEAKDFQEMGLSIGQRLRLQRAYTQLLVLQGQGPGGPGLGREELLEQAALLD